MLIFEEGIGDFKSFSSTLQNVELEKHSVIQSEDLGLDPTILKYWSKLISFTLECISSFYMQHLLTH